jgi:Tol biopolymer transport system component
MHVDGRNTALVRIDPASGAALETKILDLPGASDQYHRWSPDGRLLVYESVSDGSWNLWVVDANGNSPHQLTSLPGNERQATWRPGSSFIYFIDGDGAIQRVDVDTAGRPAGQPHVWLKLPARSEIAADSLDFTRAGDRLLVTVVQRASAIWLVELSGEKGKDSPQ